MLPMKLRYGDTIGVVSPSTPVTEDLHEQIHKGIGVLERLGFHVCLGEHLSSRTLGYAASPQEKAADLNAMFADTAIQAIMCSQGGATASACLPYLDWNAIKANPKIFVGISDITVLLNAIYARTGLITFHGNDLLWGLGREPTPYDLDEFCSRFVEGQIGPIKANRERVTIRGGTVEGRLLGGNLTCLLKLAGTPYIPDLTGAVLFLEEIEITPERCDYELTQLKQMGVFDLLQGVVIGYIDGLENRADEPMQMADVLLAVTSEYDFPILKVGDFGHNCPNTPLPVGSRVRVDADAKAMVILEACLR